MSSSSDRPPDPAHVASPHFLRNRGRPDKRKSESPLAADTMVRTGLVGRNEERADEHEQERGDRGGSPTKKVKRSSHFSPASASSSSLLVSSLDSEAQAKLSKLNDLERDAFLARTLQDQLDKPLLKESVPLSPKSEAKRQTQLALDEDLARALMEEEMREAGQYHSDSDIVMTDDSQLDVFDNSDEDFNGASPYDGASGDWNDAGNYAIDVEEKRIMSDLKRVVATEKFGDLSPSVKSNYQLFKAISGMEDCKREETEKMFKELLEYAEKGFGKQRESGNRRRSSMNASYSSITPQGDPTVSATDPANTSISNKPREVIDLTTPCEPSASVAKLQEWYSSRQSNPNCRTCHGDLTIDNSNAAELISLWTGINLMAKTPENPIPPILNRASLSRRLRLTPSRAVSEDTSAVSDMSSKGEDVIQELSYLNLFGTAKCKGSCAKVSCLECGAHCDNARISKESPTWHCEGSRPLSLLIVLGALDEWVLKGKIEDAARRRKNEKAGHDRAQREAELEKCSSPLKILQRPDDAARRPYETKLRELLELESGYGAFVQKMEAMKRTMSGICELRRILDKHELTFKEAWANEESLRETLKLMELKLGSLKGHLFAELDALAKQKQIHSPTLLSRIRKHAGDNHQEDHVAKPLDTMRTTRSMSAKMAGLKDRILSKSSAATSKQEKKKSLFGHVQKVHGDGISPLSATSKYANSIDSSGGVHPKSTTKPNHGGSGSKYKKPNGTGYGGGPYYSNYHDMEDFDDYDSLEEYADSLASPTDSVFGWKLDAAENSAYQKATAKQPKALDPSKPPPHKLSMAEAFHDFMAEYSEEAKTPGSGSFKPDDLTLEANPIKGSKSSEWTGPVSPGPLSDLAWRPPAENFHQFNHPFAKQAMPMGENNKAYVESPTAKKMPTVFSDDTKSHRTHKFPLSLEADPFSLPHPHPHPHPHSHPAAKPLSPAAELKQLYESSSSETPHKKGPYLIDLNSVDEVNYAFPPHAPCYKYSRMSERLASKALESGNKDKVKNPKTGSSANDSIIIDPDSDEGSSASKPFKLAQRSTSADTTKKTTLQPHLSNGVQGHPHTHHRSAPLSPLHSPMTPSQGGAFQLPPILAPVARASTNQHQANTGAPMPQPHLHQAGTFLPYASFHASAPMHTGIGKGSAHLNTPPKPQGHGWDTYAKTLDSYAQTHDGAIPHLPYHAPSMYGLLPGFTQMAGRTGPPSSLGLGSGWASALHIPSPPEPPIHPYIKSTNGSGTPWTGAWPANVPLNVPPPPSRRVAKVASVHMERRNMRQEHQDRILRSIFKVLTAAMPGEYGLLGHHTYPIDANILLTMLNTSWLGEKMEELLRNDSMTDISKRSDLYVALLGLTKRIGQCAPIASFLGLPRDIKRTSSGLLKIAGREGELELENDSSTTLWELLEKLVKQARVIMKGLEISDYQDIESDDMSTVALCVEMVNVFESMQTSVEWSKEHARELARQDRFHGNSKGKQKASDDDLKQSSNSGSSLEESAQAYRQRQIHFHQNRAFEHITDFTGTHYHMTEIQSLRHSPKGRIMHLTKELATMATSLPEGIFIRVSDGRPDVMKCMIIGPEGTPYEGGLFEFDIWCPEAYPNCPPKCQLKTTGGGTVGFNPNLYPDGKVCLSILGTWSGAPSEMWQPRLSTLLQVFISIQSMILCPKPYYNEPGRVEPNGRDTASENFNNYVKVQCDVVKEHFTINSTKILETVTEWSASVASIKSYDPRDAHSCRTHRSWTRASKGRNLLEELENSITALAIEDTEPSGKTKN